MFLHKMKDHDLVLLRDKLHNLHTGAAFKEFVISDGLHSTRLPKDDRLNDLLWTLFIEAHNELARRFIEIKLPMAKED